MAAWDATVCLRSGGLALKTTIAVSIFLCSAYLSIAHADENCEGHRLEHNLGTEVFSTSSRVIREDRLIVYETCVENRGERDLWVNWKVPGPVSYVPPGRAVVSRRVFPTEQSVNAVACLEYGSLAKVMREPYLGHEEDKEKLSREQEEGCRSVPTSASTQGLSNSSGVVATKVRLFVPSDREQPEATMLEFIAEVGASYVKGLPTEQTVSYSVQAVRGREGGNPKLMSIRLAPEAAAEGWASISDAALIKDGVQLGTDNEINLTLDTGAAPVLKKVRYEILDESDRLVGAFDAPVWVSR
jgi:hypothetical protein